MSRRTHDFQPSGVKLTLTFAPFVMLMIAMNLILAGCSVEPLQRVTIQPSYSYLNDDPGRIARTTPAATSTDDETIRLTLSEAMAMVRSLQDNQ